MKKDVQRLRAPIVIASVALLFFVVVVLASYRYYYPYGMRPACLQVLLGALRSYSLEHDGFFPNGGGAPPEALRELYPRYLADCTPLAGLSGNTKLLKAQVLGTSPITTNASSWVYWPGLRSADDEHIALFWERESGVRFNGSLARGREVGYLDGTFRQVLDDQWADFIRDQEKLREKVLSSRNGDRNASQLRAANQTVQGTGASRSAKETNQTSGAAGSRP
jgi:hypothetical protein